MKTLFKSFVIASIATISLGGLLLAFTKTGAKLTSRQEGQTVGSDESGRYEPDDLAHFHWMS